MTAQFDRAEAENVLGLLKGYLDDPMAEGHLGALRKALAEIDRQQKLLEAWREAMNMALLCIEDQVNVYCPEFCDENRVAQAKERHAERGTLYYYSMSITALKEALALEDKP